MLSLRALLYLFRILEDYLHISGLDAPYWTAVFKVLKVTVQSFKEIDAIMFNNLLGKSRNKDENEKIVTFAFMMKQTNFTAQQQKPSENKVEGGNLPQQYEYSPESMLALTKEWPIEDLTIQDIRERLEFLLKVKKEVISKTKDHSLWIQSYLTQPLVVEYLMAFIKKIMSTSEKEMVDVIKLFHQLIEKLEIPEILQECPQLEKFIQWLDIPPCVLFALNEIKDINSFISFLKSTLKASQETFISEINWTKIISEGVEKVRIIYQQTYYEILISVLIHPYHDLDSEQNIRLNSHFTVECLLDSFLKEKCFFSINSKYDEALQAYLLYVATASTQQVQLVLDLLDKFQLSPLPNILHYAREVLTNPSFISDVKSKLIQLFEKFAVNCVDQQLTCEYISIRDGSLEAHKLAHSLNLCKYYPKKMKLQDALRIKEDPLTVSLTDCMCTPDKLSSVILHKLMSYDSKCRSDITLVSKFPQEADKQGTSEVENDEEFGIHPMDCLITLFLCCDDFLLQDLFSRLAKCQLAVPFLLTDPFTKKLTFPLWAMRSIVKEFFVRKSNGDLIQKTCPIVKYPMKIVSFLRLGAQQQFGRSKSKIINQVISGGDNDHFFHYDLAGGQHPCVLGSGLVDMSWYLPSGKITDAFPEALTFLNLHGDARFYTKQCQVLSKISSVCFAVVTENIAEVKPEIKAVLSSLNESNKLAFLIATKNEPPILKAEFCNSKTISLNKNAAQINSSIQNHIKYKLENADDTVAKTIEDLCDNFENDIEIDESNKSCATGKDLANSIKDILLQISSNKRDAILPLQGKSWKNWASADKEQYRVTQASNQTVGQYVEEVKQTKNSIRFQQLKQIERLNDLVKSFITSLRKLQGSDNFMTRNYFLQFLKLDLNYLSQNSISEKQHRFKLLRIEIQKESGKSNNKEEEKIRIDKANKKLVKLHEEIVETSFGLEHLLRELGQIYECANASKSHFSEYADLPGIVAELLIDGYPIEIMDGDAAHVPLQWVMDVLEEANKKLGNPKIFVFSVLGIQSSGKSTMLNTIFGLQFNVSAGRCTRGAFMQLLQLDDGLKKKTKCSYVLIIDTEGLRAPELNQLSMQKHDNELATFVIGLASMTFINIYGEVAGDMDDILQTSVHAFLRMSEVKIYPSCKLVHQNAGMNINCEVGRVKLTEKLNKFAVAAAEEEGKKDVLDFQDVISFNDTEDVHYFPGLWKGEPPMAPVDRGYSVAAQVMKQQVINILLEKGKRGISKKAEGGILLSDFRIRLSDLWYGLLKENFVFSFRNTMEIIYYNHLETEYNKWDWKFRESVLQWQQKAENEIKTEPLATLDNKTEVKINDLQSHVNTMYNSLKQEMDKYFENEDILTQWKVSFDRKLNNLKIDLQAEVEKHCNKLKENRKRISEIEEKKDHYVELVTSSVQDHIKEKKEEHLLLQQNLTRKCLEPTQLSKLIDRKLFVSQKLNRYKDKNIITQTEFDEILVIVQECGDKLTEEGLKRVLLDILKIDEINKILGLNQDEAELSHRFNDIWSDCIKTLPPSHCSSSSKVRTDVEHSLISHVGGKGNSHIVEMLREKPFEILDDDSQTSDAVKTLKQKVMDKVHECMEDFHKQRTDFNPVFTIKILNAVDEIIDTNKVLLSCASPDDRYSLYRTVGNYAVKEFEEMADIFHKQNDPRLYLEEYIKRPLYIGFKNTYQQIKAQEGVSDTLCAYLEEPIRAQVHKILSVVMVTQMKDSDCLFSNKMALKVKVLLDLHNDKDFQSYLDYLRNVKDYLPYKLEKYTVAFCNEKSSGNSKYTRLQEVAKKEVSRLIQVVIGLVNDIESIDGHESLKDLENKVRIEIGVTLPLKHVLAEYDAIEHVNLDSFKKYFASQLENLEVKIQHSLNEITCEEEMKHWEKKPHELLQNLIGCTEQCPFCGEQCDLLQPDHDCDHRVEIHRVDCLKGYRRTDTQVMTTDFCQECVSSDILKFRHHGKYYPYKDYKTIYPKWDITPDNSSESSLYWKWFVGKYNKEIAEVYKAKPADVPDQWSAIEWSKVEQYLRSLYNLHDTK